MKAPSKHRYIDQVHVRDGRVFCTCSDSTVWTIYIDNRLPLDSDKWFQLPQIPQPHLEQIAYNDDGEPF